jgi:hypothetical protein
MKAVIKKKKMKDEVIPTYAMKANRGSSSIAPLILNPGIIWSQWTTPHPATLPAEKELWYPLGRRLGKLQSCPVSFGEKNILPQPDIEPWIIRPIAKLLY